MFQNGLQRRQLPPYCMVRLYLLAMTGIGVIWRCFKMFERNASSQGGKLINKLLLFGVVEPCLSLPFTYPSGLTALPW